VAGRGKEDGQKVKAFTARKKREDLMTGVRNTRGAMLKRSSGKGT